MSEVKNPILEHADQYRAEAGRGQKLADIWSVVTDLERNIAPLWDAQRLRADTAEAALDELRTSKEAVEFNLSKVDKALLEAMFEIETKGQEIALSDEYAKYQDERVAAAEQRAEAAEAELNALRLVFENSEDCELNDAELKLAATEQRIERMSEILQLLRVCASVSPDLKRSIDAALNPNPEAESHE